MIELLTEQANEVTFNLEMEGGEGYSVVLTIANEGVDYRFKATRAADSSWAVAIPKHVPLPVGEHPFTIDVVMDNHIYPAVSDKLTVKKPIKPQVAVVESSATAPTLKPVIRFIGDKKPPNSAQ